MNKGPDWTPAQWIAGIAGFFVCAALAYFLDLPKGWGTVLMAVGLCIPAAIIRWRTAKNRNSSNPSQAE